MACSFFDYNIQYLVSPIILSCVLQKVNQQLLQQAHQAMQQTSRQLLRMMRAPALIQSSWLLCLQKFKLKCWSSRGGIAASGKGRDNSSNRLQLLLPR